MFCLYITYQFFSMLDYHAWTSFSSHAPTYHHHGVLVNGRDLICNDSQIDNCVKECARQFAPMDQQACVEAVEAKWARFSTCFDGSSTVIVKGRAKPVCMRDLDVGDYVLDNTLGYTKIVGWLHRDEELDSEFLVIHHQSGRPLVVTDDHLLFCATKQTYVPSSMVDSIDSMYIDGTMVRSFITKRETVSRKGVYAPLTQSGALMVNGVHVSCYASPKELSFPVTQSMANFALWPFIHFSILSKNADSYCKSLYYIFAN